MEVSNITAAVLRNEGITIASLARRATIPSSRLHRALNGNGIAWLSPGEQERLLKLLDRHGLLSTMKAR